MSSLDELFKVSHDKIVSTTAQMLKSFRNRQHLATNEN